MLNLVMPNLRHASELLNPMESVRSIAWRVFFVHACVLLMFGVQYKATDMTGLISGERC